MKYYYDTEFLEGTQTIYSWLGLKVDTWFRIFSLLSATASIIFARIIGIDFSIAGIIWLGFILLSLLLFGLSMKNTPTTIDLISIAFVGDNDISYYAISKDFNLREAWNRYDIKTEQVYGDQRNIFPEGNKTKVYWIRENVLLPIFTELLYKGHVESGLPLPYFDKNDKRFTYKNLKQLINQYGKTNKQIAREIIDFVNPDLLFPVASYNNSEVKLGGRLYDHFDKHKVCSDGEYYYAQPEFYGYYSAYDHVVLCWLFGKMIDLPKGFPMYTIDLKQIFDEKQRRMNFIRETRVKESIENFEQDGNLFTDGTEYDLKKMTAYPSNKKEHSALGDARWNKELHEFLSNV